MNFKLLPIITLSLLAAHGVPAADSVVWTNTAGGAWSVAANWNLGRVPAGGDSIFITNHGIYAVTVDVTSPFYYGSLELGGATGIQTLTNPGTNMVFTRESRIGPNGRMDWAGGSLAGGGLLTVEGVVNLSGGSLGKAVRITANGSLNISGSATKMMGAVTNDGIVILTGTGTLTLPGSQQFKFHNRAGGIFDIRNDAPINGGGGVFIVLSNDGLVRKSAGAGISSFNLSLTNTGVFEAQTGTIKLMGSSWFGPGSVFTGAGTIMCYGTPTFNGAISSSNLVFDGGGLAVSGNGVFSGRVEWRTGSIASGASATIATDGRLDISGTSTKTVAGSLTNAGQVVWSGTGLMTVGGAGKIHNLAGATWDTRTDASMSGGGASTLFINDGIYRKSASPDRSLWAVGFLNRGTLAIDSGAMRFAAWWSAYTHTNGVIALNGGAVEIHVPYVTGPQWFFLQGGSLTGIGNVSNAVANAARIAPAAGGGVLRIVGHLTNTPAGALEFTLGGTNAGVNHSRLDVTGQAILDGALRANLAAGYLPTPGDRFQVLSCSNRSGAFSRVTVPPDFSVLYANQSVSLLYRPSHAPLLSPMANTNIDELTLLSFIARAIDPDPTDTLTFTLLDAPAGAAINASSGLLTWTPTEAQGPTNSLLRVVVSDNGSPSLSATQSCAITVNEVNRPPVLEPIANANVNEGALLSFTVTAADADLPTNRLTFALVDPPAGASLDSTNGLLSWIPTAAQGPGAYSLRVVVSDSGTPSLSATQRFSVLVSEGGDYPITVTGDRNGINGTTIQMAYDGNLNTYFQSSYGGWQYVQINRGCVGTFSGLRRYMARINMASSVRPGAGEGVSYSVDGVNWTPVNNLSSRGWENEDYVNNYHAWMHVPYGWSPWLELNEPALARFIKYSWDWDYDRLHEIELMFAAAAVSADLALAQTVSSPVASVAQPVLFALSITNAGPGTALNVMVTNPLPAEATFLSAAPSQGTSSFSNGVVRCVLGELAAGANATIQLTLSYQSSNTFENTATVSSDLPDLNPTNNTASVSVRIGLESQPVFYSDETFNATDWTAITLFNQYGTVSHRAWQDGSGSAAFRRFALTFPVITGQDPSGILVFDRHDRLYHPAVQGPIASVNMSGLFARFGVGWYGWSGCFGLEQNGVLYQAGSAFSGFSVSKYNFATMNSELLTATSFSPWGAGPDHPDFSASGAPIRFGLFVSTSSRTAGTYEGGIDNWVVTINKGQGQALQVLVPDLILTELIPWSTNALASDVSPGRTLTWSLVSGPPGLTVSPAGLIAWTPDEAQGPGSYTVTLQAAEDSTPERNATGSFHITVNEVNQPPGLDPIANATVNEGTLLSFTVTASDADLPANSLAFALVDPPPGASINSTNGLFSWTPTEAQGPGAYSLRVAASDNGTPSLSSTQSFSVFVNEAQDAVTVIGDRPGLNGTTVQMAYDGNLNTYFRSSYIDWQYIVIDRGCVGLFSGLRRYMSKSGGTSGIRASQGESVSYSIDGVNWTRITATNSHGWETYGNYGAYLSAWMSVRYGWSAWLTLNQAALARYVTYA